MNQGVRLKHLTISYGLQDFQGFIIEREQIYVIIRVGDPIY